MHHYFANVTNHSFLIINSILLPIFNQTVIENISKSTLCVRSKKKWLYVNIIVAVATTSHQLFLTTVALGHARERTSDESITCTSNCLLLAFSDADHCIVGACAIVERPI
jgi:hypothetical protein